MFANEDAHDKFVSRTGKQLNAAHYQSQKQSIEKWAKVLNGYFSKEGIHVAIKHIKKKKKRNLSITNYSRNAN